MSQDNDEMADAAAAGILSGDLAPLASYLLSFDDVVLWSLAELIQDGELILHKPIQKWRTSLWLEVGAWMAEQERAGITKIAEKAAIKFPVSQRTAERCRVEWDRVEAEIKALIASGEAALRQN